MVAKQIDADRRGDREDTLGLLEPGLPPFLNVSALLRRKPLELCRARSSGGSSFKGPMIRPSVSLLRQFRG